MTSIILKVEKLKLLFIVFTGILTSSCFGQIKDIGEINSSEWYLSMGDNWYYSPKIYVKEVGNGPDTVVVLHGGWGAEHSYLLKAVEGLENDFHFIFYDQRGSLRSPCADSLISVSNHIKDLERLRSQLGLKKMNLIGHSTGGFLAMAYLEKYPDNVGKLVLLSPIQTKYPVEGEEELAVAKECESGIREFFQRKDATEMFEKEGLTKSNLSDREFSDKQKIYYASKNIYNLDRWRELEGGGIFFSQKANNAAKSTMPESWNYNELLSNHPYPVTLIFGDHDIVDSYGKLHRYWFANDKNVKIVVLENAGHNSWIDQPDEFRLQLLNALNR